MREEHNICKNRRNYGDSPVYLNPLGFLAGNPATLVVGGSVYPDLCASLWHAVWDAAGHAGAGMDGHCDIWHAGGEIPGCDRGVLRDWCAVHAAGCYQPEHDGNSDDFALRSGLSGSKVYIAQVSGMATDCKNRLCGGITPIKNPVSDDNISIWNRIFFSPPSTPTCPSDCWTMWLSFSRSIWNRIDAIAKSL